MLGLRLECAKSFFGLSFVDEHVRTCNLVDGRAAVCFGLSALCFLLFPLCFLFLVVPLPGHFVDSAAQFLQHQSAVASEFLFRAVYVPVTRHGIILSIPTLDIEVARECSSIRSSTMLMVITLILAHLFLRSSWRKVVLVVAAVPLSVAKNAVRIFTIAELGTRVDPGYLNGRLHHNGGMFFSVSRYSLKSRSCGY